MRTLHRFKVVNKTRQAWYFNRGLEPQEWNRAGVDGELPMCCICKKDIKRVGFVLGRKPPMIEDYIFCSKSCYQIYKLKE